MSLCRIDRFDDPRLDQYRNVADGELLRRHGMFVAEGRLTVRRLIESGRPVCSLLLNEASYRALTPSLSGLPGDTPVYTCETGAFTQITGFHLHRGCLALAPRFPERSLSDVADQSNRVIVLEGVTDADNIGSVFRNAAAFGVGGIILSPGCCDPLYRKAIRTSMGSVLRVPYMFPADWPGGLVELKAKGFTLVALTPHQTASDLVACDRRQIGIRLALLVGSEGSGLTLEAQSLADIRIRIPIDAAVDSLNLATATGIALHHFAS
jgi:tRNA G18 (ribose-2'-O)-methylase SpoU